MCVYDTDVEPLAPFRRQDCRVSKGGTLYPKNGRIAFEQKAPRATRPSGLYTTKLCRLLGITKMHQFGFYVLLPAMKNKPQSKSARPGRGAKSERSSPKPGSKHRNEEAYRLFTKAQDRYGMSSHEDLGLFSWELDKPDLWDEADPRLIKLQAAILHLASLAMQVPDRRSKWAVALESKNPRSAFGAIKILSQLVGDFTDAVKYRALPSYGESKPEFGGVEPGAARAAINELVFCKLVALRKSSCFDDGAVRLFLTLNAKALVPLLNEYWITQND